MKETGSQGAKKTEGYVGVCRKIDYGENGNHTSNLPPNK
jgi:hypothetical protein